MRDATLTGKFDVLEFEVVQQRPCDPSFGACMAIETSGRSAMQFPRKHVCNDARATHAKSEVVTMIALARQQGFHGEVSAYFPPGTYGEHVADANGQLAPRSAPRPAPRAPAK
jgi:hypothetical protein